MAFKEPKRLTVRQPPFLIYIVDDDEDDLLFISNAFKEIGLENVCKGFLSADDLFQDLKFNATSHLPDAIVLDYEMPKMNGKEVLKKLIRIPDFENIPFIFYSDNLAPELETELKNLGAACCIKKGVTTKDQQKVANQIIDILKK